VDSAFRARGSRLLAGEYEAQKAAVPDFYREAGDISYVTQPKVSSANVDRMARDLTEQVAKVCFPSLCVILRCSVADR
jgi:hypothetical protein